MKYEFTKAQWIDQFNFNTLSDVHQAQFFVAGKNYFGDVSLIEIFDKASEFEFDCAYYKISEKAKGKHLFDFWTFGDDGGTLFNAGETQPNGVVMIQSHIDSEGDEETEKLADELHTQFKKKATSVFEDDNGDHSTEKYTQLMGTLWKRREQEPANVDSWSTYQKKIEDLLTK